MRKFLLTITATLMAIVSAINLTGCTDEYRDMLRGEVRLKENDYRNDENVVTITASQDDGDYIITATEIRALWHATVINAENYFENSGTETANLYDNQEDAKKAFYTNMSNSLGLLAEKYPDRYAAIIKELHRAGVHAYIYYMWCAGSGEYVRLKFEVNPDMDATQERPEGK